VLIVVKVSLVRLAAIEVRREAFDVQLRNVDLVDDSTELQLIMPPSKTIAK